LSTNNKNVWQAIKTVVLSPADVPVLILTDLPVFQKHDEEESFNEESGPSTNPSAAIDLSFAKDSHEDDSRLSQYDGISFDKPISTTSQEVSNKMDISLSHEDDARLSQYDDISFDKPISTTSQEGSNKMDISLARESQQSKSSLSPQFRRIFQLGFNRN
jgi:hypothetical protein